MKISYEDLVTHYGLSVCDNELNCVYSRSAHSRGKVSHWRGDVMHWSMNRRVTRPGIIAFLRAVARDTLPHGLSWRENIANECMWAQREAQEKWGVAVPPNAFRREKSWVRGDYDYREKQGKLSIDEVTTPIYTWSHTQEGTE